MAQGKRTFLKRYLANAVAISADYQSPPSDIREIDRVCYVIGVTGTVVGTVTIQTSLDYDPANPTLSPGTWDDMDISLAALSGASQRYVVDLIETAAAFIRVNIAYTSGSGNATIHVSGKES